MSATTVTCWAGIDVSKLTFDAAVAPASMGLAFESSCLRDIPARQFPRTPEGAEAFLAWAGQLQEGDAAGVPRVVMEATGAYSTELAAWLVNAAPESAPAIANPRRTANFIKSLGVRNKTDKLEARGLALYGLQRRPAAYQPLSPERAELRNLLRYRDALVKQRAAETMRGAEQAASSKVRALQKRRSAQLDRDIKALEKEMAAVADKCPALQRDMTLLTSMYGVAFITAAVILAEIGDLREFARARQLTAFAGISPRLVHSGTSRRASHLCKEGNGRVRQALYMAATTAVRGDNQLAAYYRKLRNEGKPHKPALTAIMRKMLTVMRAILIHETAYDPHRKNQGNACGKHGGKVPKKAA